MKNRTIAAISTPLGPGGIGVIRISGPHALPILKKIFVFQKKKAALKKEATVSISSHRVYYGYIHDRDSDSLIDEVLVFCMEKPNSYTREDVVEIQSHSGYVVLDRILSAVLDAGGEMAKPGEFSQRAFLNGRIDLTQAEGVIDLINASCDTAAKIAVDQVSGGTKSKIDQVISLVTELHGKCEAVIEFDESDDLMTTDAVAEIQYAIYQALLPQISSLIQNQKSSAIFCDGVLMTIAGVPNVGKSSLLNQLAEKEMAIVSEIPGTTRDVIREYLSINGIPVVLCDTAGLHETQDPLECIGIKKAHDHIDRAEILLFVVDASRELNPFEVSFLDENSNRRMVITINKSDIADAETSKQIKRKLSGFSHINVSAKTGSGISGLKDLIFNTLVGEQTFLHTPGSTPNLRQRKVLERIEKAIIKEREKGGVSSDPAIIAEMLVHIRKMLEEITGATAKEDVYDYIFSQFCVGK